MTDAQKSDQILIAAVFTKNDKELKGPPFNSVQHENILILIVLMHIIFIG